MDKKLVIFHSVDSNAVLRSKSNCVKRRLLTSRTTVAWVGPFFVWWINSEITKPRINKIWPQVMMLCCSLIDFVVDVPVFTYTPVASKLAHESVQRMYPFTYTTSIYSFLKVFPSHRVYCKIKLSELLIICSCV